MDVGAGMKTANSLEVEVLADLADLAVLAVWKRERVFIFFYLRVGSRKTANYPRWARFNSRPPTRASVRAEKVSR